ncbi:autotransporter domain-containing protein [Rhodanobacter sp. B2A1Ga4]|uniref:S8 family serine peptidase n=1 Tax=Rhodanobacter sp. B2A1Ga4 TaxID=2778647 RepID=UPI001B36C6DF|nr:S8 family serine peptidase [Rhodanobacter sp. B2A1Ga4]MBQ4853159.1 autotransporter domain-containing protein [Rhodanobacter sp. B2A1Ga4]
MKMLDSGWRRREMAWLVAMALGLSACGGGGGSKPTPPPAVPSSPPPAPPPSPPPSTQPPLDAQLSITRANAAQSLGYTGAGVTIGVVDSGIMRSNPTVTGRVTQELIYVDPTTNNTSIDDVVGHGTWVSEIAAGRAFDKFPGGIAPGASLVSARIISDVTPKDDGSGQGNAVTAADAAFFAQTLNPALISAGVQVMNNSWGGIYWDTTNASINQAFGQAYQPFVVQHGGLVVFAAGNESRTSPSDIASLPTVAPGLGLDQGWLVAVALDSNHPTQLASYSNACGRTMNYCLAAPGDVIVLDKDTTASTTNPTYWVVSGTSFAAPEVSGAAALVWQAFPYFSNDLVRQTLLGTARDLGAPGPDPTFGYGALDVFAAVQGPAKFDWGDVTVNFSGTSTWSNPISGAGGLIKQGSGRLNLWGGESSYTGLTQVQGGTLAVAGLHSPVEIGAAGTLMSASTQLNPTGFSVYNDVTNAGVLVVSQGDVHLSGNYVQQGNGRMAVSLGSQLYVNGTATLSGGDLYVYGANANYTLNSHTTVLSAYGGLTGTFSALSAAPSVALTATLGYDASSAWLDVQQVNLSQIQGLPYTAASFGAALRTQSAFQQINSQLQGVAGGTPTGAGFVAGAASLQHAVSTDVMQRSLESLSGQLHAASAAMTFEAIDAGTRALSDRFDRLLDAPQAGAWTQGLGYHGGMSRSGYGHVGYDLSGALVGQDLRVGSNGIAGYALSQSQGLGRLAESADQGRSRALEGMLYGGMVHGSWYAMGRFGVGNYRETMRRQLQLGNQFAGVASDVHGRYGVAYGESGYRFALGRTQLTPYMNLQYAQIRRDGFDELGAYGFGLKSAAQSTARWQAGTGLRASHEWALAGGGSLSLQGRMLWQQSFGLRGDVFDASFSGINQFAPVGGIGLSRYGGMLGTTLDWKMTPRASLQFGYDRYLGQGRQAQMASASFSWAF